MKETLLGLLPNGLIGGAALHERVEVVPDPVFIYLEGKPGRKLAPRRQAPRPALRIDLAAGPGESVFAIRDIRRRDLIEQLKDWYDIANIPIPQRDLPAKLAEIQNRYGAKLLEQLNVKRVSRANLKGNRLTTLREQQRQAKEEVEHFKQRIATLRMQALARVVETGSGADAIELFRRARALPAFDQLNPSTGTVATLGVGGKRLFSFAIEDKVIGVPKSVRLRESALKELRGNARTKQKFQNIDSISLAPFLNHAEAMLLLLGRQENALGKEVTINVDREPCGFCQNRKFGLPDLLHILDVDKLNIYHQGKDKEVPNPFIVRRTQ